MTHRKRPKRKVERESLFAGGLVVHHSFSDLLFVWTAHFRIILSFLFFFNIFGSFFFKQYFWVINSFVLICRRPCIHRLVTDIPATTGVDFGHEIVCYESPQPSMGIHRFVFVLFQQLGRQTVYAPGWRQNFNTRDFAELYNLGSPIAAVYFNCQRESGTGGRRR
nr:flowering locus protein FT1 [Ipomoea batatas]